MKQRNPLEYLDGQTIHWASRDEIETFAKYYSAHRLPKVYVFGGYGYLFTCMAVSWLGSIGRIFVDLYPLIEPEKWQGPNEVEYSSTGKEVEFRGKRYRLGPKMVFGHPEGDKKKTEEQLALI